MQQYTKMIKLDAVIKEDIKEHNPTCPHIPDLLQRILTNGGSESGKTN